MEAKAKTEIKKVPPIYVDKKTESYPTWLADVKYDKGKSFRQSYVDTALKRYARTYSMDGQETRDNLIEAKINDELTNRLQKKAKKNWRDSLKFVL